MHQEIAMGAKLFFPRPNKFYNNISSLNKANNNKGKGGGKEGRRDGATTYMWRGLHGFMPPTFAYNYLISLCKCQASQEGV